LRIANYYRNVRRIPPENIVYLDYHGPDQRAAQADFLDHIRKPTLEHFKKYGLESRIHCWVTTPGLPYRIENNGISGSIHFGEAMEPKKSLGLGPAGFEVHNQYAGLWLAVSAFHGIKGVRNAPLHMHLWAGDELTTLAMIDRSARADFRFPEGVVMLCDGVGPRASRAGSIPHAHRMLERLGATVEHFPGAEFRGRKNLLGVYTGCISFPVHENTFVEGALADHLTSLGGVIDAPSGQMSCIEFLKAGCSATFGTVVEPYNYPQKFPSAIAHVAYAAGFTAVESYWQSIYWPQQAILLGDPLTRPFGRGPEIWLKSPTENQVVTDQLPLEIAASSRGEPGGVGMIDVWIDHQLVANLGMRRLPKEASLTMSSNHKNYSASTKNAGTVAEILADLHQQMSSDGYWVSTAPASIFLHRKPLANLTDLAVATQSPVLHARVLKAGWNPGSPRKPSENGISGPQRLDWDFAWIRLATGPKEIRSKQQIMLAKVVDGIHTLRIAAYEGNETLASTVVERAMIKRSHANRLRIQSRRKSVSLQAGPIDLADYRWEGVSENQTEFCVNSRPVPSISPDPKVFVVDPKAIGVGKHIIRARAVNPADGKVIQHSDEELELTVTP
jgi:uncharacterized protein (TIGR03790 family)